MIQTISICFIFKIENEKKNYVLWRINAISWRENILKSPISRQP